MLQKDYSKSIYHLEKSLKSSKSNIDPYRTLALAYAQNGQKEKAIAILNKLLSLKKSRYVAPYKIAIVYIALGEMDKAFDTLNQAYEEHDWHLRFIWHEPVFYAPIIQTDPRYRELLDKMQLGHLPPRTTGQLN